MSIAQKTAQLLLEVPVLQFSLETPFTWASGLKSPVYCDNRLVLSQPKVRAEIKQFALEKLQKKFPEVQGIVGVATGGGSSGSDVGR